MAESAELKEAVFELHQYLSDRIAPLMVADSMGVLLQYPAGVMASEIQAWVAAQSSVAHGVPLADFLFHAVKKVALMGEFDLVSRDALREYLADLGEAVLPLCPEPDRELLRQSLAQLGHAPGVEPAAPVEVLHRQAASALPGPGAEGDRTLSREVVAGLRRLSLILQRLQHPAAAPPEQRTEVASQFMTTAAVQSTTDRELGEHLEHLRRIGIETDTDKVIRTIAQSVPGWTLPPGGEEPAASGQMSAIRQIVSLAEDPAEQAKRFRELVHAAIEQFNEGHLGRAATMFELAEQLAADKRVQPVFVEALRKGGSEYLDAEKVRKLAERADARPSLRTVLGFFFSLQPDGLLKDLDGEPRRERRHELLALLEAHGAPARARAYELLKASVEPSAQVDPFFQMNLVYLLRVIPRPEGVPVEEEIAVVMQAPGKASPAPLVKQVIAYLAATRHEKAERALITYLRVFENMLVQPETAVYPPADVDTLLERTCAALARYGTPRAWRALVDHGLKTEVRLGSTLSRLVEAGKQDLSTSKDLVERLLGALKAELPRSVLGFTVKKNTERIAWLIQALSGTPTPEVRQALQEIAEKHAGQPFAETAAKALAGMEAAGKPAEAAGLTGDLDLFGLPGLLQTLGQGGLTGVLTLMNASGQNQATLLLEKGRLRGAQCGVLRGRAAAYQLFERPFSGSFAFVSRQSLASQAGLSQPEDVIGLILEGVRRHDELKRSAALVPDTVPLAPTGTAPTPLPDEDEDFVHLVWKNASAGTTAAECEAGIATDSYSVRRLLAHWVEEGALRSG